MEEGTKLNKWNKYEKVELMWWGKRGTDHLDEWWATELIDIVWNYEKEDLEWYVDQNGE